MRNLIAVALALALSACATVTSQPDCLLGVNVASFEARDDGWDDSLDVLITHAVDQGRDTWTCPAQQPRRDLS